MRSIGPLQWTNSELNKHEHRDNNYSRANQSAEILLHLLGNIKVNKEEEEKLHRHIVHPYQFRKLDGKISAMNNEKHTTVAKSLLKTPEGVIEAKQLTLILAHEEFSTITFEEPDRGMHPHMIKKMRDLILKHVSGKTVLIISHNPSIIDNWAMPRTFICSKQVFNGGISHSVFKIPADHYINKYSRINEMKSLLFSSRILLVEGITDKIILDAIFCVFINGDKYIRHEKHITTEQQHSLISIDIREVSGKGEGYKKEQFCEKLGKEVFLLFDSDQTNKNEKGNVFIWETGAIERRFIDVIDNGDEASVCACNNFFRKDLSTKAHNYNAIDKYKNRLTEIKILKKELTKQLSKKVKRKNQQKLVSLEEQHSITKVKIEHRIKEKQLFQKAEPEEIVNIARSMINYSCEIDQFIKFLTKNNSNANYEVVDKTYPPAGKH